VNDGTPDNTGEEGFKELTEKTFRFGNTIGDEYLYDDNGNMTRDDNKGLTSIEYNYLNLPKRVNKSLTEYLTYTYDATGRKLRQQVYGTTAKVTDYSGEYVYENDTLRFVNHEEGRILPDATVGAPRPWEYQYFLKDHLGNVRVTFSEKTTTNEYTANMEASTNASFFNYNNRSNFNLFDHTDPGTTNTYSQLLNGGSAGRVGLAKSLAVNPGDVIDLEVYAKYEAPSTESNASDVLGALIAAFGLQSNGANYIDGQQAYNAFNDIFSAGPYIGRIPAYENGDAPRAYLNYILFDENFELVDFGFDQVSTDAEQIGDSTGGHELLTLHVKIQQKGYLYIYLSNEQPVRTNVYFDDLKLVHHTGVEQVEDYYPFGLTFNSTRTGEVLNSFTFGGKESQSELALGWIDFGARMYSPDLGRWASIDPHSSRYEITTPYNYAFNNPMLFVDPTGMDNIIYILVADGMDKEKAQQIVKTTNAILEKLGLSTRAQIFEGDNFDDSNLDKTDNWVVIGEDRKKIDEKVQSITTIRAADDVTTVLADFTADWAAQNDPSNPEISDRHDMAKGVAVDHKTGNVGTHPTNSNPDPYSGTALSILHGAGHSAASFMKAELDNDGHTASGVMSNGNNLIKAFRSGGVDGIIDQENSAYINAMNARYGTKSPRDNYQENKRKREENAKMNAIGSGAPRNYVN
ncbi:MAG TPA: RHS repeat-associated core domain-containing protein, partial [Chryseosolibacter sp.]|nr:RHS repeat-associated core domain-containing protein [Chryseosolibacter sp.]